MYFTAHFAHFYFFKPDLAIILHSTSDENSSIELHVNSQLSSVQITQLSLELLASVGRNGSLCLFLHCYVDKNGRSPVFYSAINLKAKLTPTCEILDRFYLSRINWPNGIPESLKLAFFSFILSIQHFKTRKRRGSTKRNEMKALTLNKRRRFITSHGCLHNNPQRPEAFRDSPCVVHHPQGHFGLADDCRKMNVLINLFPIFKSV